MMMTREARRLAGDFGALVPDVNRHRLFTFDGRALGADGRPPALVARSGPPGRVMPLRSLRCPASQGRQPARRTGAPDVGETTIWLP
jgi:hypothetical protein